MSFVQPGFFVLLGAFIGSGAAWATIPEKYQTIIDRNSFGLNPPVLVEPTPTPVIPPSDIKLTGFTQMSGQHKAYFVIQSKDAKEPPRYVSLAEGDKEGALELIKISEKEGEAQVKNTGVEMVLSLKNNGFKPGASAAPPVAAASSAPASVIFNPDAGRKTPASVASSAATPIGQMAAQNPQGTQNNFPAATVSSSVVFNATRAPAAEPKVDPAVQYLNMLVQEQAAKSKGQDFPPVPPMPDAPPSPSQPNTAPPPPSIPGSTPQNGPPPIPR